MKSTRPALAAASQQVVGCPYLTVALGHPSLRLKTLIVVERDGRRVFSTKPVVETTGFEASEPGAAA